jgi:tetratricopeptide (TPR) repeat protein
MNVALRLEHCGIAHARLGRLPQALRCFRLRLQLAIEMKETAGLAYSFLNIAGVKRRQGADVGTTRRMLRVALRLNRAAEHAIGESESLAELALLELAEGRPAAALELLGQAVVIAERVRHQRLKSLFCSYRGEVLLASGEFAQARVSCDEAIHLVANRYPYEWAVALTGSGAVDLAVGDPAAARRSWAQALALFTRMDAPERLDVERRLAALESGTD